VEATQLIIQLLEIDLAGSAYLRHSLESSRHIYKALSNWDTRA